MTGPDPVPAGLETAAAIEAEAGTAAGGEGFRAEVDIDASPEAVWRALTDAPLVRRWMGVADVRSTWRPGAPIELDVLLEGRAFHDRGTVLEALPARRLRYSHWSEVSRRPDVEANRSVIAFDLEAVRGGRATRLTVHQERPGSRVAAAHWRTWWPVALASLKAVAEGREPVRPIAFIEP